MVSLANQSFNEITPIVSGFKEGPRIKCSQSHGGGKNGISPPAAWRRPFRPGIVPASNFCLVKQCFVEETHPFTQKSSRIPVHHPQNPQEKTAPKIHNLWLWPAAVPSTVSHQHHFSHRGWLTSSPKKLERVLMHMSKAWWFFWLFETGSNEFKWFKCKSPEFCWILLLTTSLTLLLLAQHFQHVCWFV